ncbi:MULTISPECIES: oxidoreductase family protein [unclassified Carboxylicivirga]|uniref:oxidoreductase family protein n=1 Tax=Carboxylicivirga TaxID=1628153 RepID=UPI003D334C9D
MEQQLHNIILKATGASTIKTTDILQNLWSGYGKILRVTLQGGNHTSVVVKHVKLPDKTKHPRGWNTDLSHQRKLTSYKVETAWYAEWNYLCTEDCRTPQCLYLTQHGDEVIMVLEDLDEAGYPLRLNAVSWQHITTCLRWLANFHATFLHQKPDQLWPIGTYWHLDTRPDEWRIMDDQLLKAAASAIDKKLRSARFQTFVHGDAKLANFCFAPDGRSVAAVDFQYVGGGCGMKDLAYFVGSCLYEEECESMEKEILDTYFKELKKALQHHHPHIDGIALEQEWRALYPVAWTDFHRFLKGWSPDHWKINSYSERVARETLATIHKTTV